MLARLNPFNVSSIFNELDYLMGTKKYCLPEIDVVEDDDNIIIEADIPGFDKENIEIDLKDNILILKGKREIKRKDNEKIFSYYERSSGSFSRSFVLPENIIKEDIVAECEKGILKIIIPKIQKENLKEIKINIK